MIYLSYEELMYVAQRTLGAPPLVRDAGLLESALARPQASVFGSDAYPEWPEKAGALLHSLAKNHALVDGNKRMALAATISFLGMNGFRFTLTNDEAYDFVISVVTGELADVADFAAVIRAKTEPR